MRRITLTKLLPQMLLLLLGAACLLPACGGPEAPASVQWMESKPNPIVGSLRVAVVERLGPDRVRVEAHWVGIADREGCAVDLGLPAGVIVLEGDERLDLAASAPSGETSWILEYPLDLGPLDAVVRYCVQTPEGVRAAQCAVRLTE
jgi:hypothetical protein